MRFLNVFLKLDKTKIFLVHVIVIVTYMLFSILFILNQDLFKGFSMDGYHNDYCLTNKNDTICSNHFKKNKFIYILIDGGAYDQLYELREKRDKYNITRIFRGITSDYKQSAVNHEIMFSGKKNRNFIGHTIKEDNLFYNLFNAGLKFTYRGIKLIMYNLVGKLFFDNYVLTPTEKHSMDTMCNFSLNVEDKWTKDFLEKISDDSGEFKQGYDKEYLYSRLDQHFENELSIFNERGKNDFISNCFKKNFKWTGDESIIYYGNKIDHINHNFHKHHVKVIAQMYVTEKILIRLLDWCYDHPDYAFFYATDHGGQEFYGEDNIINHGGNEDGNEATFFAYIKDFTEDYYKYKLPDKIVSLYDFSTLISQLIEGGVVPLESLGVPYPVANDNLFRITSIKAKGQQLMKFIKIFGEKYPKNNDILKPIYDDILEIYSKTDKEMVENTEKYLNDLRDLQDKMENEINENNKNIFFIFAFYIIVILLGILLGFDIYTLKNIVYKEKTWNVKHIFFYTITIIFGLFFPLLFVIFYPSNILYDKLYTSVINQYYAYSILLVIYIIFRFKKMKKSELLYFISLSIILGILPILCQLFYKYELFLKMKRIFTNTILSKIFNFILFYPVFAYYMYREIKKLKYLYFDREHKNSAYYFFSLYGIIMFIFMVIFEIAVRPFFEVHNFASLISNHFVFLIGFIFLVCCFIKYYANTEKYSKALGKTAIIDGFPILKFILMLYQFYLSDEAERILLLFAYIPLLELLSSKFLGNDKITKLLLLICFMGLGEIFYVITQRFFSFDISIKVLSRTVGMTGETFPLFSGILMGTHKLRYFMLLTGYLMSFSRFHRKEFFTETSFMIRMVIGMQLIGKIVYFYYRYFNNLIGEEFLELFMWTMCHVIIFGLDIICLGIYELIRRLTNMKKKKFKLTQEQNLDSTGTDINPKNHI